ncbi:hypothetical protein BHE74_00021681 [Ensete ventricosum]|nr:hypothetical protein GW17_00037269 [Ensete ventricosum]RWW70631.1 hypothetical protein BHE74_00021681 [Ensete ventricosum]RZR83845.1 hypothetical protein BHM03_00010563 [Ensete ventricosum]
MFQFYRLCMAFNQTGLELNRVRLLEHYGEGLIDEPQPPLPSLHKHAHVPHATLQNLHTLGQWTSLESLYPYLSVFNQLLTVASPGSLLTPLATAYRRPVASASPRLHTVDCTQMVGAANHMLTYVDIFKYLSLGFIGEKVRGTSLLTSELS